MPEKQIEQVARIQFGVYTEGEKHDTSVVNVQEATTLDVNGNQIPNGLADKRMGAGNSNERGTTCSTCGENYESCQGHSGRIPLKNCVLHPLFVIYLKLFLRSYCTKCFESLLLKDLPEGSTFNQMKEAKKMKSCVSCGEPVPSSIKIDVGTGITRLEYTGKKGGDKIVQELTPSDIHTILDQIPDEDISKYVDINNFRPSSLVLKSLNVSPNCTRPRMSSASGHRESTFTQALASILKLVDKLERSNKNSENKGLGSARIAVAYKNLLYLFINQYYKGSNDNSVQGIAPGLQGKGGTFRANLSGKRVDNASRDVITCAGTSVSIDEVGIPMAIATQLTQVDEVTLLNKHYLQSLVDKGPDSYPGAKRVIITDDTTYDLRYATGITLKVGWRVERFLQNGDYVLLNRQPTLHRGSMMSHRVKVIQKGDAIKLHPAHTTPYNADFDGDEMNVHIPVSLETFIELMFGCPVSSMLLKSIGCIQDSLLGCYMITEDGVEISGDDIQSLISTTNISIWDKIKYFGDKRKKYDGKEVISSFISKEVNMNRETRTPGEFMRIKGGEILPGSGRLDKKTIGTGSGTIHRQIFKRVNDTESSIFLGNIVQLSTDYLQLNGFTIGLKDVYADEAFRKKTAKYVEEKKKEISETVLIMKKEGEYDDVDAYILIAAQNMTQEIANNTIDKMDTNNSLYNMVMAKSKGDKVNISQVMGIAGVQMIAGKLVENKLNGRSLPHFYSGQDDFESRGGIGNNFTEGPSATEFFFHLMAAREGLVDTAIKTAKSGYVSRKLVKSLDDLSTNSELQVVDSQGTVYQNVFGSCGMDPDLEGNLVSDLIGLSDKDITQRYLFSASEMKKYKKYGDKRQEELLSTLKREREYMRASYLWKTVQPRTVLENVFPIPVELKNIINSCANKKKYAGKPVDPATAQDLVSRFVNTLEKNYAPTVVGLLPSGIWTLLCPKMCMTHKYTLELLEVIFQEIWVSMKRNLIRPGTCVGIRAAQKIGERITQMTLNTFHSAGKKSQENLGIPRFTELFELQKKQATVKTWIDAGTEMETARMLVSRISPCLMKDYFYKASWIYKPTKSMLKNDLINEFFLKEDEDVEEYAYALRVEFDIEKLNEGVKTVLDMGKGLGAHILARTEDTGGVKKKVAKKLFPVSGSKGYDLTVENMAVSISETSDRNPVVYIHTNFVEETIRQSYLVKFMENVVNNTLISGFVTNYSNGGFKYVHDAEIYTDEVVMFHSDGSMYKEKHHVLEMKGTNLLELIHVLEIDREHISTNCVLDVYDAFGITEAKRVLECEIQKCIDNASSHISRQDLTLLVDFMSHTGELVALNRHGVKKLDMPVLSRASFENTLPVLVKAAVNAEVDNLKSVSSCVIIGKVPPIGTNYEKYTVNYTKLQEISRASKENEIEHKYGGIRLCGRDDLDDFF